MYELRALAVLLEERSVSRAATRFHLSQPSMSRTLQRLRSLVRDELLVRSGNEYELTPRARAMQRELTLLLPRLENLIDGFAFDPATATGTLRLVCTDYSTATIGPYLLPRLSRTAPDLEILIQWRDEESYANLERGRVDLVLSPITPPDSLAWEPLFTDDLVCLVDRHHPVGERFTADDYLSASHVVVSLVGREQPLIERWLQPYGRTRKAALRVVHFGTVTAALPDSELVATIPRRLAELQAADPRLRLVEPPEAFGTFEYGMIWHPRLTADPAHGWLRDMIRAAAGEMTERTRERGTTTG